MTATQRQPIWFNPPKFWAATRNMPPEQADRLMDVVFLLAEIGNVNALKKFDFIGIGYSYLHRRKELG